MNMLSVFNLNQSIPSEVYINELIQINEEIKENGLVLTLEDAKQIITVRNKILKNYGRLELSLDATKKLIEAFSISAFINDKNYVSIINDVQETFYYLKNETEDKIGDDKLIDMMRDLFENSCEGSMELLNSCLEEYARNFRKRL